MRPDWESVRCAWCGAAVGQHCLNPDGSEYRYVHRPRYAAFDSAEAKESQQSGSSSGLPQPKD